MSTKKITRLKSNNRRSSSPLKALCPENSSNYCYAQSGLPPNARQSQINDALVNQLNSLYKEIEKIREDYRAVDSMRLFLLEENIFLRNQVEVLSQQYQLEKEKYLLERQNHERLRKFYQRRQKQWKNIIQQQTILITDLENSAMIDRTDQNTTAEGLLQSTARIQHYRPQIHNPFLLNRVHIQKRYSEPETAKSLSPENNSLSFQPFMTLTGRGYASRWLGDKSSKALKPISEGKQHKTQYCDGQSQQLFDKILRTTLCDLQSIGKSLTQLKNSNEMMALISQGKNCTRQQLRKAVFRLKLSFASQKQKQHIYEFIVRQIQKQHHQLNGQLVYNYLLEKFQECGRMAADNSSLRFQDQYSRLSQEQKSSLIDKLNNSYSELGLNSNIKTPTSEVSKGQNISSDLSMSSLINNS